MSLPLTKLTCKGKAYGYDVQCEERLKKRLTTALVLIFPNPSDAFVVYCDASYMVFGGVLM